MSCAFVLWSGIVSWKSCKWTWWVELLQPQIGFLGCRQKLWSCTDKLSFSYACTLSLRVIWLLSTHPSIPPPLTSTLSWSRQQPVWRPITGMVFTCKAGTCSLTRPIFHSPTDSYVDELEPPADPKHVSLKSSLKKKKWWEHCMYYLWYNRYLINNFSSLFAIKKGHQRSSYEQKIKMKTSRWVSLKPQHNELHFLRGIIRKKSFMLYYCPFILIQEGTLRSFQVTIFSLLLFFRRETPNSTTSWLIIPCDFLLVQCRSH